METLRQLLDNEAAGLYKSVKQCRFNGSWPLYVCVRHDIYDTIADMVNPVCGQSNEDWIFNPLVIAGRVGDIRIVIDDSLRFDGVEYVVSSMEYAVRRALLKRGIVLV